MNKIKIFNKLVFVIITTILMLGTVSCDMAKNENKTEHTVLDCSLGIDCTERKLEYTYVDCNVSNYWDKNTPDCKKTSKNLNKVHYIADPATHVPFPFTKEKFEVELIDVELRQPWDLSILPDGSMLITERTGRLVFIRDGKLSEIVKFEPVVLAETGFHGLAIDPEFIKNRYIYLYITYAYDNSDPSFVITEDDPRYNRYRRVINKISRFKFVDRTLKDEYVLIDNIPGTSWHTGGRLEFGPDNKLYATTGDAEELELSQYETFLGGKVLRMNTDGSIPSDNPYKNSYVYSMGHRNPQGIAWQPETNEMYGVEHGHLRYDELNRLLPGINYGWGSYKCDEKESYKKIRPNGKTKHPIYCAKEWTMAPSGMEYITDKNSPWYDSLFLATLRGKHLHRFKIKGDEIYLSEIFFVASGKEYITEELKGKISQRLRDVEYYNNALYIIGDYFGLVKLSPVPE